MCVTNSITIGYTVTIGSIGVTSSITTSYIVTTSSITNGYIIITSSQKVMVNSGQVNRQVDKWQVGGLVGK